MKMKTVVVGALMVGLMLVLAGCPCSQDQCPRPEGKMRTLQVGDTWVYKTINETTLPDGTVIVSQWDLTETVEEPPAAAGADADALALKLVFTPIGDSPVLPDDYVIFKQDADTGDLIMVGYSDAAGAFYQTDRTDVLLMLGSPRFGDTFTYGTDEQGTLQEYEATVTGAAVISTAHHSDESWIVNISEERIGYSLDEDFVFDPALGGILEANLHTSTIVSGGAMTMWQNQLLVSTTVAEEAVAAL